nr:reverse transcriptase zinc-binding domain-containing protein [Tanacetum cinerariifolium]
CIPRHAINLWLIVRRKLKTQDLIPAWDVSSSLGVVCSLCESNPDSHDHLFFECLIASGIWNRVKGLAGLNASNPNIYDIIQDLLPIVKYRTTVSVIAKLVVAASAYYVWQERNWRLFKKGKRNSDQIVQCIVSSMRLKLLSCKLKKSKSGERMTHISLRPYLRVLQIGIRSQGYREPVTSSSTVTYTSISSDYVEPSDVGALGVVVYGYDGLPMHPPSHNNYPEYLVPSGDEAPIEDQPLPADASPTTLSPGYVADSDSKEDPEEDHADYPADGGDGDDKPSNDDDDDDGEADDEDEEAFEDEDDDEARKTVRLEPPMSASIEASIVEHVVAPTPPPHVSSPPLPLPSPLPTSPTDVRAPLGYREAGIMMRALLLSTSYRTDIPEAEMPPRNRACFTTPSSGLEVGESSAAGAARQPWPTLKVDLRAWIGYEDRSAAIEAHVMTLEAQKMTPKKRTIRTSPATTTTTTTPVTDAQLRALISWGVVAALAERDADRSRNGDDSHDSRTGRRRQVSTIRACTYTDFLKCQPLNFKGTKGVFGPTHWTVRHDVAYAMPWKTLKNMITDKYCPRGEIKKLETKMWNLKVKEKFKKYVGGLPNMIYGSVKASKPKKMQEAIEFATELMDQKILTLAERQAKKKRKFDYTSRNNQNQQQPFKRNNVARAYTVGPGEKKPYGGSKRLSDCLKLRNGNQGNRAGNGNAVARAYAMGTTGTNPNSNVSVSNDDNAENGFKHSKPSSMNCSIKARSALSNLTDPTKDTTLRGSSQGYSVGAVVLNILVNEKNNMSPKMSRFDPHSLHGWRSYRSNLSTFG